MRQESIENFLAAIQRGNPATALQQDARPLLPAGFSPACSILTARLLVVTTHQ